MERTEALLLVTALLLAALLLVVYGDYRVRSHVADLAQQVPPAAAASTAAAALRARGGGAAALSGSGGSGGANINLTRLTAMLTDTVDLEEQLAFVGSRAEDLAQRVEQQRATAAAAAAATDQSNSSSGTGDVGEGNANEGILDDLEANLQEALRAGITLKIAQVEALRGKSMLEGHLADAVEQMAELQAEVDRLSSSNYSDRSVLYEPPTRQYKMLAAGGHASAPSYARLTARRPLTTPEDRENYCLFLLHFTRKAPPAYCEWTAPDCTFPALVTGLGGAGTHTAAEKLKEAGLKMPHEGIKDDGSVGWMYAVNEAAAGWKYPYGRIASKTYTATGCQQKPDQLHAPRYERVVHQLRCPIAQMSALTSHSRGVYKFIWDALAVDAGKRPPFAELTQSTKTPPRGQFKVAWTANGDDGDDDDGGGGDSSEKSSSSSSRSRYATYTARKGSVRSSSSSSKLKTSSGRAKSSRSGTSKLAAKLASQKVSSTNRKRSSALEAFKKKVARLKASRQAKGSGSSSGTDGGGRHRVRERHRRRALLEAPRLSHFGELTMATLPPESCMPKGNDMSKLKADLKRKPPLCRLEAAARAWLAWNEHIERFSDAVHRVEDIGAKTPQAFCNLVLAQPQKCADALKRRNRVEDGDEDGPDGDAAFGDFEDEDVEVHVGKRPHWNFKMDDLFEADEHLARWVMDKALAYGYWQADDAGNLQNVYDTCDMAVSDANWESYIGYVTDAGDADV